MAIHLRGSRPLVFFTYTSSTSRAKVGDLQLLVFTKENITTGQVTMDDVQTGKVLLGWKGQG